MRSRKRKRKKRIRMLSKEMNLVKRIRETKKAERRCKSERIVRKKEELKFKENMNVNVNVNPSRYQLINLKIIFLLTLFSFNTNPQIRSKLHSSVEAKITQDVTLEVKDRSSSGFSSPIGLQPIVKLDVVEKLKTDAERKMKTRDEFLESLPVLSVSPKHTARFECELSQDGTQIDTTKLVWLKLNRKTLKENDGHDDITLISLNQKLISPDRRFRVSRASSGRFQLTLENVDSSDHQAYFVCQIGSNLSRSRSSGCGSCGFIGGGRLNVLAPPRIVSEKTSASLVLAREYEPLTLHCKVFGDPRSQITWKREDSATLEGAEQRDKHEFLDSKQVQQLLWADSSELFFANFTRHQAGAYLCIASNGVQPGVSQRVNVQATDCRASFELSAPSELCLLNESNSDLVEVTTIDEMTSTFGKQQLTQLSPRKVWQTRTGSFGEQTARASRTRASDKRRVVNVTPTNNSTRNLIQPNYWKTLVALYSILLFLIIHYEHNSRNLH